MKPDDRRVKRATPRSRAGARIPRYPADSGRPACGEAARRWGRLLAATLLIAVIWLQALPWIGRQGPVHRHVEQLNRRGIDASAMYYTELEILPEVIEHLDQAHRRAPRAFWSPSPASSQR